MIETKTCGDCGAPVEVEIPDGMHGPWQDMLRSLGVLCKDCGRRFEREEWEAERAELERAREERHQRRVDRSELPRMLRGVTWADLDDKGRQGALSGARRWAAGELSGLVLTGPVGVGKTTIAAAAAWAYLDRSRLQWTSVPTFMARLGAGFNDPKRAGALALLEDTDALVLDDMDKTRPSEYAAEQLFNLVDGRIKAGSPLLVTTNLMPDELAEKFPEPYGTALASRLAGYCEVHGISGHDRRTGALSAAV